MAANTIHLSGDFRGHELPAGGTLYPGMLVQENSSGQAVVHSVAGGAAEKMFVFEDSLQGKLTTDTYTSGDRVRLRTYQAGAMIQARVLAGSDYTVGTALISDGAGRLKPTTGSPAQVIATVITRNNLSASGASDGLCEVVIR